MIFLRKFIEENNFFGLGLKNVYVFIRCWCIFFGSW